MAQELLTNATGAAMMARLVVRMTKVLIRQGMPEDNVESAVEEIMGEMGAVFGPLGAQVEAQKQRPFIEKGGRG